MLSIGHDRITIDHFRELPAPSQYWKSIASKVDLRLGHLMEFGVFEGRSINFIASQFSDRPVWGFDSFEGLPDDWKINAEKVIPRGTFDLGGRLPATRSNVILVKGLFSETLPTWTTIIHGSVAMLHIDCDLCESASTVLRELNEKIVPGTIVIFDELCAWDWTNVPEFKKSGFDYRNWENGEWKAMVEWMRDHDRKIAPFIRDKGTSAAVIVTQ